MSHASPPPPGRLYLVATPIGNLEDITLRALRILKEVDAIAAEDTRRTLKLLSHFGISKPLISFYKDIERQRTAEILNRLLQGERIALVTDAGTPGISDPGTELVRAISNLPVKLEVIPGPSALLAALAGAGLPTEAFSFYGFLDAKSGPRRRQLEAIKLRKETQVFFLPPHRLLKVLEDLHAVWGNRKGAIARELTKVHEEFVRGVLSELILHFSRTAPRGEFTLVIEGCTQSENVTEPSLESQLIRLQSEGNTFNQAIAQVARQKGLKRAEVYAWAHKRLQSRPQKSTK